MTERRGSFMPLIGRHGWGRSALGALLGLLLTGFTCRLWLQHDLASLPFLIAPMGASAVLLFAVPASPLAQPWSIVGGNMLSALAGHAAYLICPDPILAAALAVAGAIIVMSLANCLHPPGGAVALTSVIGGPAVTAAGWSFAFIPVGLNSLLLLACGWLFHKATRHDYPHRAVPSATNLHGTIDLPPLERIGFTTADINEALADHGEVLDINPEDLHAVFRRAEARAHRRLHRHRRIDCADIMSRDIVCGHVDDRIDAAYAKMRALHLLAMPVVDSRYHVQGLIELGDLDPTSKTRLSQKMRRSVATARPEMEIEELLPILAGGAVHQVLVTDKTGRLMGIITQTDLLAALWQGGLRPAIAAAKRA